MKQLAAQVHPLPLSHKWLKAAVLGSVWAAFEIIAGSFLHNLRVPFAGMFLASASVLLLIAFLQIWNEKGMIIRAGIICALMKSISPSAIILGPMLGIFMEALLIELVLWLLGRHLLAFLIAGALAVIWTLIQKLLNLLILYGFDLIRIAEAFYQFLAKNLPFVSSNVSFVVLIVFSGYALMGATAAWFGYTAGKRYQKGEQKPVGTQRVQDTRQSPFFGIDPSQTYSFLNLGLVLVAIVGNLILINKGIYWAAGLFGFSFMLFCAIRYKRALRHLKKPMIWIQFLIVTLIAALFWDYFSGGSSFSFEGLRIGLEMNFRAMIIIFGFSAISVELRNPLIKVLLFRNGFSQLYGALSLAFSALPAMVEQLPRPKKLFRRQEGLIRHLLHQSELLLKEFEEKNARAPLFIITGEVHQGKTRFVKEICEQLMQKDIAVSGFLSVGYFKQNQRHTYALNLLPSGKTLPLAAAEVQKDWFRFRRFWFNPDAFELGNKQLLDALKDSDMQIIVVDEVGPMEEQNQGWHPALTALSETSEKIQIWVIRNNRLEALIQKYKLSHARIVDVGKSQPEEIVQSIEKHLHSFSL